MLRVPHLIDFADILGRFYFYLDPNLYLCVCKINKKFDAFVFGSNRQLVSKDTWHLNRKRKLMPQCAEVKARARRSDDPQTMPERKVRFFCDN